MEEEGGGGGWRCWQWQPVTCDDARHLHPGDLQDDDVRGATTFRWGCPDDEPPPPPPPPPGVPMCCPTRPRPSTFRLRRRHRRRHRPLFHLLRRLRLGGAACAAAVARLLQRAAADAATGIDATLPGDGWRRRQRRRRVYERSDWSARRAAAAPPPPLRAATAGLGGAVQARRPVQARTAARCPARRPTRSCPDRRRRARPSATARRRPRRLAAGCRRLPRCCCCGRCPVLAAAAVHAALHQRLSHVGREVVIAEARHHLTRCELRRVAHPAGPGAGSDRRSEQSTCCDGGTER